MPKKETIHSLSRQEPQAGENDAFMEELINGSDRSSALVGCAGVDASLVWALKCKFIITNEEIIDDYFYGQKAVLGNLSARIRAGFLLAIFDIKFSQQLDTIRRVRNVFAHAMRPIGFDHELIINECQKLQSLPQADTGKVSQLDAHKKTLHSVLL